MKNKLQERRITSAIASFLAIVVAAGLWSGCATNKRPVGVTGVPAARNAFFAADGFVQNPAPQTPGTITRSISVPSGPEELWIIARAADAEAEPTDKTPGTGALLTTIEEKEVPLPLKHTDVRASVSGYIGSVEVVQHFHNPYDRKIEAVYVFPLPHNAAVNDFVMTIGERRIRGIIRERAEAEQIYRQAKIQGLVASMLTEERPNVFTQSVANIEPGREIDVAIKYFHALEYVDGWYEFVFPMVVGPRFNPPGTGQEIEVKHLTSSERSGHDISLQLNVDAGVEIEESRCATHEITQETPAAGRLTVALKPHDRIPNRDFVLRYRVAGEKIKSDLITQRDRSGGYFTLMLFPPKEVGYLTRQPLELVFVLDCSGSMNGRPIEQAKAAVERGLRLLRPEDSFQIINFSTRSSQLGGRPLAATPENVQRGLKYLGQLEGEGGTMMIEGIRAALNFPHDPARLRFVCFLTDGYIGNETEILSEIHRRLGASRIFSFGIGSSVNRYLLDEMAKTGRGAVAYLGPRDQAASVMEDFFARISHPGLTDLAIDWGGMRVSEVYPRVLPDLFVGRPVMVTGRFQGSGTTAVRVSGQVAGERLEFAVPADMEEATHAGLPSVWARLKMADLAERSVYEPNAEWAQGIKQVALDYGLMSAFTAFVAVDAARRTEGPEGTTVPVAVPMPDGMNRESSVPEKSPN